MWNQTDYQLCCGRIYRRCPSGCSAMWTETIISCPETNKANEISVKEYDNIKQVNEEYEQRTSSPW